MDGLIIHAMYLIMYTRGAQRFQDCMSPSPELSLGVYGTSSLRLDCHVTSSLRLEVTWLKVSPCLSVDSNHRPMEYWTTCLTY